MSEKNMLMEQPNISNSENISNKTADMPNTWRLFPEEIEPPIIERLEQMGILDDSNRDFYEKITENLEEQPRLTRQVMGRLNLLRNKKRKDENINYEGRIVKSLEIDGLTFYFDGITRREDSNYLQVIVFVESEEKKGIFNARFFYKSNSAGGWRSCPGIDQSKNKPIYSKGRGHYTQATKPTDNILNCLESLENPEGVYPKTINFIFNFNFNNPIMDDYKKETEIYNDGGVLDDFRFFPPPRFYDLNDNGELVNSGNYFENIDFNNPKLEGFLPDFSNGPISTRKTRHSLLSEKFKPDSDDITIENFPAILNGKKIIWSFAYDNSGRVWIDRISLADAKTNSFGISSQIINSGLLTNKPLEYNHQTTGLEYGVDKVKFNEKYDDITPLLDRLKPIKEFREARNIHRIVKQAREPEAEPIKKKVKLVDNIQRFIRGKK